jgi:sigma-E factor negative regulatory protein RseA
MVMREQISRLMDGDLEGAEADAALRELKGSESLEHWACYHIIGDVLRRNGVPTAGFASRFAARLDAEPTVLAPQPAQPSQSSRLPLAWAVAATVAAVAVVSSVAVSMLDPQPTALAKAREANAVRTAQPRSQPVSPDYLLAHQEYSPTTLIQGVGPYLRAVSAGGADGRP